MGDRPDAAGHPGRLSGVCGRPARRSPASISWRRRLRRSSSSSCSPLSEPRNSRMPLPSERPSSGSRFGPKTIRAMIRTMPISRGPMLPSIRTMVTGGRVGIRSGALRYPILVFSRGFRAIVRIEFPLRGFDRYAMADASRTDTRTATGLHVCPECGSALVQPTCWEQADERGHWRLWRRCPECEWRCDGVHGEAEIDAFDEELDRGTEALAEDLRTHRPREHGAGRRDLRRRPRRRPDHRRRLRHNSAHVLRPDRGLRSDRRPVSPSAHMPERSSGAHGRI